MTIDKLSGQKISAVLMTVTLLFSFVALNVEAQSATPTIDVKANGSDGPVVLVSGNTYTYSWVSTNATACTETSPVTSGITLSGSSATIGLGHPFYPTASSSVTITVSCTDGTTSATDSVVISLAPPATSTATTTPTIDVKANGSDGPVVLTSGTTYTYTWDSANATACTQTSPVTSGITLNGSSATIGPGHPFYPTVTSTVTITVSCTDGTTSVTDLVVIQLAPPVMANSSGGGGGGGNGGGGTRIVTAPGPMTGGVGGDVGFVPIYAPLAAPPSIPNTGFGGDVARNLMILFGSTGLVGGSFAYLFRLRRNS